MTKEYQTSNQGDTPNLTELGGDGDANEKHDG